MLSETPYRGFIQSEIKPFRSLLLGFFFIPVGLTIDLAALARDWSAVIAVAVGLLGVKVPTNVANQMTTMMRMAPEGAVMVTVGSIVSEIMRDWQTSEGKTVGELYQENSCRGRRL